MRALFKRKRADANGVAEGAAPNTGPIPSLESLRDEIGRLSADNRVATQPDRERQIVQARHLAGIRLTDAPPAAPEFATPGGDLPADSDGLPEFTPEQLTPELVRAAILRDGCVLVRGLISRDRALTLADGIETAYQRREQQEVRPTDGYYDEFVPHERSPQELQRAWVKEGGGLLGADSPRVAFELFELLRDSGIDRLATDYLGEPALIAGNKTTLRKADPAVTGEWHQDGRFMGDPRSLNMWLSLSQCGDVSPGLDIVPVRLSDYVATGTDGAALSWTVSDELAETAGRGKPILRPLFQPGDALFFDQLFLHRTGLDPSMALPRYAIENWFFGGSTFPDGYVPIAV